MPDSGRGVSHLTAVYCLAEERKQVAGGKRRSQDLMSGRITASPSISCMVTSGPIVYPVMEDQFQLVNRVDVS
jgi:hypothetical protein